MNFIYNKRKRKGKKYEKFKKDFNECTCNDDVCWFNSLWFF